MNRLPAIGLGAFCLALSPAAAAFDSAPQGEREVVLLSDLHLGSGRGSDGTWQRSEDFRWPAALARLLDELGRGPQPIDLVILGDFLELWQRDGVPCPAESHDVGCTTADIRDAAELVTRAHDDAFRSLRDFAARGENRLYVVPGNHDAALLVPEVWTVVGEALGQAGGHVLLVSGGIWSSADGGLVAEHGHQVGWDVNAYPGWPIVTATDRQGRERMVVPWGERFVQGLFNEKEQTYPVIDNLSPESASIGYLRQLEGTLGTATEIARAIAFNLFQTSLIQKGQSLGPRSTAGGGGGRTAVSGRQAGSRLIVAALPDGDPFREAIVVTTGAGAETRAELDRLTDARQPDALSDAAILDLCDRSMQLGHGDPCSPTAGGIAGAVIESWFPGRLMAAHLAKLVNSSQPWLATFVYGHTHLLEPAHPVDIAGGRRVEVLNTGAFQRVMKDVDLRARADFCKIAPAESLNRFTLERDFKPCYGIVRASRVDRRWRAETWFWHADEDGSGRGFVAINDPLCHWSLEPVATQPPCS
jgi:metallophosphoesterase superfamily enzyme